MVVQLYVHVFVSDLNKNVSVLQINVGSTKYFLWLCLVVVCTCMLMYVGFLRPSTLLRYCGQVFLLLAGSSPATYFMCWCWWSITNIYIRCILWKAIDECWIVRVEFCWFWQRTIICASCLCQSLPFFCQYCWSVDGLGVTVVLVCLRCFICRGVDVGCLCLNTSCIVTNSFPFRLPLVHTLGVSSPGGR